MILAPSRIVSLVFATLAMLLSLLIAAYWLWSLEPRLTADAAARAAALAQAQSGRLAIALSGDNGAQMAGALERAMDTILLVRDPSTDAPMVHRLELLVDYQQVAAAEGSLDLRRGAPMCSDCFVNEIPLYHETRHELIAIAQFHSGRDFLDSLIEDVRNKLVWGSLAVLLLIGLAWAGTNQLLRRLHLSEENLRGVFEAAPFPMVLNEKGRDDLLRANRAAFDYLGLIPDDSDHLSSPSWLTLKKTLAAHQPEFTAEFEMPANSSEDRWALVSSRPVSYGGRASTLISLADISQLKQVQNELRLAKEEAESSTRAKSAFVATMSHEIRTPLNAILGMAHLLTGEPLTNSQRRHVRAIHEAGDALLGLVTGILDFSQIEAGRLQLDLVEFDLNRLVANTLSIFDVKASQKGIELRSSLPPDLDHQHIGDKQRIQQILINLMGNAVKFTESGWIKLEVMILSLGEDLDSVEFHISDSGMGIEQDQLIRLFEEFTQGDSSVSRRHGGTGLGLAICRRLTEIMDGEIHAESVIGEGSRFTVILPLRRGSPITADTPEPEVQDRGKAAPMRILVVDDERLNRVFLQTLLARSGHRVEVAENGHQALEIVQRQPFDLIFMDIRMPVMDGLEATRRIRVHPNSAISTTPMVALTADVTQETLQECASVGMDEVIPKPLSPDVLERILLVFGEKSSALDGPAPPGSGPPRTGEPLSGQG